MADKTGTVTTTLVVGVAGAGTKWAGSSAVSASLLPGVEASGKARHLPVYEGMYRRQVIATKPGGVSAPKIFMIPEGVKDFTLYVVGSDANSAKIYKSIDSASEIFTGTPVWRQVHVSLDSVGTTMVRYVLGNALPTALKVECLVNNKTATMVVLGKRVH